jgi:peptidoglycan/xylan/chitin deacetylase (PgdA/CDA1 family)
LEEVLQFLAGAPAPDNPAIITFDDGYRSCHDIALPILQRHGVKAVFFIATSYVSARRVFWWDRVSYIIDAARADQIEITYPFVKRLQLKSEPERSRRWLLSLIKTHYRLDLDRFLTELAVAAGVSYGLELEHQQAEELVMTWQQVRALRRAGMEIHSHTRTHRILQTVDPSELQAELEGARDDLEQELGERVSGVSYPVGHSISACPEIRAAVSAAGYELGFSNMTGATRFRAAFDPYDMRRISIEYGLPLSFFRAMLAYPGFAEVVQ